ncbi:complement C1q-like protein 2 [Brachyhypopomus gauderio]|uniref:complement C1q-like protein 2 n=1 Tax=Brachyhypopomus gauderio TaxID=698409 RepID=UPI004042900E
MMKIVKMKLVLLVVATLLFKVNSLVTEDEEEFLLKLNADVSALKKLCTGTKVVFSVAMRPPSVKEGYTFGKTGPYNKSSILIHEHAITNIGNAYNTITGIFTAPVKGVYFFTFTTFSWMVEGHIGVSLYKNDEEVLLIWEHQDKGDNEDYASNSVTLILKQGDKVYMNLPKGFQVASSIKSNIHTFSGFLLHQL